MTEDDHSSAASNPKRSRSLRRRLRLLQSALPEVLAAAATHASTGGTERDRQFWGSLLGTYKDIELEQWCFDLLHDAHGDLVEDVLKGLEEVVQIAGLIPEEYKQTLFPRLEILTEEIEQASEPSEVCIQIAVPNDTDRIIELLSSLAAVIKDIVSQSQPPSDGPLVSSKTKPVLAPLISNLFSALFAYRICTRTCRSSPHKAALVLSTNRTCAGDFATFTVLLSKERASDSTTQWLQTGITVHKPLPQSEVRIDPPISTTRELVVRNICSLTNRRDMAPVNLKVVERSLYHHSRAMDQMMTHFQNCEPANLREAFFENTADLRFGGKICLAVVLSFSFLDFCGKPWFPGGWNGDSIFLMHDNTSVSLQPFLITELIQLESGHSTEATIASWEAKLLDHGILLMEIFNQDTFPSPPKQPGGAPPARKDMYKACNTWFNSIKWGTFGYWRQAVEACISGRLMEKLNFFSKLNSRALDGPSGSQSLNPEEGLDKVFVGLFYKEILSPFEAAFASQWPDKDPDEVISTIKLRYAGGNSEQPATRRTRNSNRRATSNVATIKSLYNSRSGSLMVRQVDDHGIRIFFDTSECSNLEHIENANEWFKYFDKIRANLKFRAVSGKKIRIGVLDTGIDMNNATISQNKARIQCWPPGADHHDNVGHGTHVAFLLLHLTKHVDLRICKITDSADIEDASINQIADAITHFSQPGKDRVDILNLSFGFPEYHGKLEPINKAIRNAASSGLIIFAAAGNEGGNASIPWPASLYKKGEVIPICSSDGKGELSGTNPSFNASRYIYTLGRGVKSCQVRDVNGVQQVIHRSGSSFATPIAAATAAIILGFVDSANPSSEHSKELEELKPRLRTRLGMEMVMRGVCVREPHRAQHYYLTPWYLFKFREAIQIPFIIKILEQVLP
ncbi:hypothetical protein THARTR1_08277 [Trichoderma harzianum]|uniref:Uncharacterized protein n=1 Tax=Trichoderma harzianum TaxID=5544 RepID=A0A2K0TZU0_TRIHA|nr:hypothetical protein THARTR1_08277 [Trichoderma harzianum]